MELTCPACGARYRIEPGAWPTAPGPDGEAVLRPRPARCTACTTIFTATPTPARQYPRYFAEEYDEAEEEQPSGRRWMLPIAVVTLLMGTVATIVLLRPAWVEAALPQLGLSSITLPKITLPKITLPRVSMPGIELPRIQLPRAAPSPLKVEAQTVRRRLADGRTAFEVVGEVRNPTAEAHPVPPVELLLLDSAGRIVGRWTTRPDVRQLQPGEHTRFETSNVDPPADAVDLRVRLNPAEIGRL